MGYLNEDGLATLVGKVKGQVVQLTSAEYRNLPASKNSDNKTYFVTDEDYAYAIDDEPTLNSDNLVKSGGVYTYTSKIGSGTLTTTAQTIIPAINELDAAIDTINTGLTNLLVRTTASTTASVGGSHTAFSISASKAGYTSMLYVLHYNNASAVILNVEGVTFGNGSFQCNGYARRENSSEAVSETIVAEILWFKN